MGNNCARGFHGFQQQALHSGWIQRQRGDGRYDLGIYSQPGQLGAEEGDLADGAGATPPTAALGTVIATAGGSTWDMTTLHDSNFSFVYDPAADIIGHIANIPRATSETRGLNFCGAMYVMGGGRDAPNPSNEVDIYDPVSNSWSIGQPFVNPRRNFATDTDGSHRIWLTGGYDATGVPINSTEVFNCPLSMCAQQPSPTPTGSPPPTATPTATATTTPRITPTPRMTSTPRPPPP